jgi:hypothetical protein
MRLFFILVLLGIVLGCGGPTLLVKDGAGQPELEADKYACEVQWEQSAEGMTFRRDPLANPYYGFARKGRIVECLKHKGWTVQGS